MLIAVTGATGFLGRYIVNHLLEVGHQCRCWHRPESNRGGFVDGGGGIEWIPGDLSDEGAAAELVRGVDAVVHSALMRPTRSGWSGAEGNLLTFAQINVMGTLRLMEAAKKAGAGRFVFISTCAVHDVILADRKLDEAHPLWLRSHYGAHKAALEAFVHSYGLGAGWPICAVRPTGIYGIDHPVEASKWYDLVQRVLKGEPIASAKGGKEVHAGDVARAVGVLLNAPAEQIAGQAFNCYDMYVAEQDIARIAAKIAGRSAKIEAMNEGPRNQIETGKLRSLGMTFGGAELLERTVAELVHAVKG